MLACQINHNPKYIWSLSPHLQNWWSHFLYIIDEQWRKEICGTSWTHKHILTYNIQTHFNTLPFIQFISLNATFTVRNRKCTLCLGIEWLIFTQEFLGELKFLFSLEGQLETQTFLPTSWSDCFLTLSFFHSCTVVKSESCIKKLKQDNLLLVTMRVLNIFWTWTNTTD